MKYLLILLSILTIQPALAGHGEGDTPNAVYVDINGLVCDFCAQTLKKVFSKKEAISEIDVNLDTKIVTINFKDGKTLDNEVITALINDSGYSVVKITREAEGHDHE